MPPGASRAAATPLPVIEVNTPCPADWNAMAGDARERFCAHCRRHVRDLSAMPSDEVADLICRSAGNLCVRFERAADGGIKTLDYQPPAARGWRLGYKWLVLGVLTAIGAGAGRAVWLRQQQPPPVIMGGICPPPAQVPTNLPPPAQS